MLAAAPNQNLPGFPKPLHTFAGPHYLEVVVDGRKYSPTCKWPGAPRRALTVWDTISDLPPIHSGHDDPSISYGSEPRSHLQRLFRAGSGASVEDHISKSVTPLVQERFNQIPTTPGADWRDLPNVYIPGMFALRSSDRKLKELKAVNWLKTHFLQKIASGLIISSNCFPGIRMIMIWKRDGKESIM